MYEQKIYGTIFSMKPYNYKEELLKEKLWTYPVWRGFVLTIKRILRKD
jgi:hypothetical protein